MHLAVSTLLGSLEHGKTTNENTDNSGSDAVGQIARVYEVARNALEYRADHLVRRAAIERILRRQMVFEVNTAHLATGLLTELKWARYVPDAEIPTEKMETIINKYKGFISGGQVNRDWLLGMMSAEIEDEINPNSDYHRFTNFAFHAIRSRVNLPQVNNLDLLLYVAVDKIYSQSDEPQIAYHLYRLISSQAAKDKGDNPQDMVLLAWKHYTAAVTHPLLNNLCVYVRKQVAPLVLIRDMYFAKPDEFNKAMDNEAVFRENAKIVLFDQMKLLRGRMNRASVRSLIYVFLTKMILAILVEVPLEKFFGSRVEPVALGINLLFPVMVMWILTANIKLPDRYNQERLLNRAWQIVENFDAPAPVSEMLVAAKLGRRGWKEIVFYSLYMVLFLGIFALILVGLHSIGFGVVSSLIFIFFLCVVSFFAFRIRQTAGIYTYQPRMHHTANLVEMLILPIVVMGGWLSRGVSHLNFLVFIFDFVLEAPFKIILRFLDSWSQFLSLRRDEAVG